jgi:hypothetical protein
MTLMASQDDMIIGVCTHYELVPMPAPTPTPLPHPFMAMINDPAKKAAMAMVETMKLAAGETPPEERPCAVYDLPTVNTGWIAKNSTGIPHIPLPPGTGWAPMPKSPLSPTGIQKQPPPPGLPPMPEGNAYCDKGSAKCNFGPGAIVRLGDTTQSCSEPARMTSTVLAIPKGGPVMVG